MTILSKLRKVKKNPSKPSAGGNSDLVKDDVPKNDDRTNSYCHINMTSSESQIRNTSDKVAVFKNSTAILKVRLFKLKNIESQSKQKYPEKYLRDLECEFRTFVENVKMVANELGCQQNAAQGIQNTKTDMDDWLLTLQNGLLQNVDTVEFCMKNMMMYEESNKKLKEDYDALQKQMTSNEERHKLEDEQNKERYNKLLNYIKILENKKSAALQIIQQKEQQRYNKLKNQTETNVKRWEREKRESMRRYHDLLQNVKSLEKAKSTQIERLKQEQQKQNAILQNVQKRSVKLQRKNARANKQYRNLLQNLKCLEKTKSTLEVQEQQSKQNADSLEDINDSTGDILHKERLLIPELIPNMTMGSLMDGTHCTTPTQSTKKKKKKKKKKKAKGGDTEPVMETSGTVELNDGKEHNESPSAEYPATLEHEKTKNDMELGAIAAVDVGMEEACKDAFEVPVVFLPVEEMQEFEKLLGITKKKPRKKVRKKPPSAAISSCKDDMSREFVGMLELQENVHVVKPPSACDETWKVCMEEVQSDNATKKRTKADGDDAFSGTNASANTCNSNCEMKMDVVEDAVEDNATDDSTHRENVGSGKEDKTKN